MKGSVIKGRGSQSRRQWQMLRLMSVNRMTTVRQIADAFEVSTKTVFRDLEFLEDAGFPLVWRSDDERNLKFVRLDQEFATVFARLREIRL